MMGSENNIRRRINAMMFKLPLMITCDEFEDFITDYLAGDLTRKQSFIFETHLKVCRECREYLRALKASLQAAKLTLTEDVSTQMQDVPQDLIKAIIAANCD